MKPREKETKFVWGAGLAAGLALLAAGSGTARAQSTPTCQSLVDGTSKKLFYMTGSSAFEPTLAPLALKLADQYVVVFQISGSGAGAKDVANDLDVKYMSGKTHVYTADGSAKGWSAADCTPDTTTPPKSQIGVSDVHPTNFGVDPSVIVPAAGATVQVVTGPVQAMMFVAPTASSATAISAEQAHALFAGCAGTALPWTDTYDRGPGSGTQVMISKYIATQPTFMGPPADATHHGLGGGTTGAGNLIPALVSATDPTKAIGILSADTYDTLRTTLKSLAFQAFRQTKAYYPDSTATGASDRRNVRDGHYVIQGPVHFSVRTTPSAEATAILGVLTGSTPLVAGETDNKTYISTVAKAGMIPVCAMKVERKTEGGYLSSYTPAKPCGCFFETLVVGATGAPASCVACDASTPCASGKSCNYGFCE